LTESISESMNQSMKTMMYLFPFFPIVGAYVLNFPIAIGLYWLTNNIWTAVQSHFFIERLAKELRRTSTEGLPPTAFMQRPRRPALLRPAGVVRPGGLVRADGPA